MIIASVRSSSTADKTSINAKSRKTSMPSGFKKLVAAFHNRNIHSQAMSSSPRVLVTGVSGYVGGHTVMRIMEQQPEWHVVLLVRNEEQKKIVLARWPKAEIVIGDLDDRELMISEGSKADVILRKYI